MHVVVNWLWQGSALTLIAAVVMRHAARLSATTRYTIWWATIILVLLLPALPWLTSLPAAATPAPAVASAIAPMPLPDLPAWPLIVGACVWAAWAAVALARIVLALVTLTQARRAATRFPAAREARLTHWCAVRSTGRSARLVLSDRVSSAAVLGLGAPVIAVSPTAARRLTDQELDQVLLHEWAHVQRHDDFARLAQIAIRSVAGLHPAVWWIGRRLEIEREIACDDYAVNITGAARSLALCLAKLADVPPRTANAALAPGALVSSQLTMRVVRLLDPRRNTSTRRARGLLGSWAAALAMLAVVLAHVELVVAASPLSATMPDAPVTVVPAMPSPPPYSPRQVSPVRTAVPVVVAPAESVRPDRAPHPSDQTASGRPDPTPLPPVAAASPIERVERGAWDLPELTAPPGVEAPGPDAQAAVATSVDGNLDRKGSTPWGAAAEAGLSVSHGSQKAATAAADAGTSVGRSSEKAAVATAGFFSKLGRKIAGGF